MSHIEIEAYGPRIAELLGSRGSGDLGPGQADPGRQAELAGLEPEKLLGRSPEDQQMAQCCLAAIWLRYDFLDDSHTISQDVPSSTGSYWHGIMHRREPDYSNAKYWFRRAGDHPVFERLGPDARELAADYGVKGPAAYLATQATWDPFRFVDLCQEVWRTGSDDERLAQQVAEREWLLLFDHCYQRAVGAAC